MSRKQMKWQTAIEMVLKDAGTALHYTEVPPKIKAIQSVLQVLISA